MQGTFEQQVDIEKRMIASGIARYRHSVTTAEENGRAVDTHYSQRLLKAFVLPVADGITTLLAEARGKPGVKAKYLTLLDRSDPEKAAYFGLRAVINSLMRTDEPLVATASTIGMLIEDELKFSQFEEAAEAYYDTLMEDFKRRGTKSYRHLHRVLTKKAKEKQVQWHDWTPAERVAVGVQVIDVIISTTDLIKKTTRPVTKGSKNKHKQQICIEPTEETLKWIQDYHKFAELLNPDLMPCVVPPDPWVDFSNGGFYTPRLRLRCPLVKTRDKSHEGMFCGDITNITTAINALQATPWKINTGILEVMQTVWKNSLAIGLPRSVPYDVPACPIPEGLKKDNLTPEQAQAFLEWKAEARIIHTMEKERVSKCFQVIRALRIAEEYKDLDSIWFVYYCDFRGRMYCASNGLSPQSADFSKALLLFSTGKPLGESGAYWLKVHGANCYGKDKLPYEDRVGWVKDNHDTIINVARDPLSNKGFWADADKPWQFLAFCLEYERFSREGVGMLSYIPIGLDGSCNGLQNFSAMLRDEVGGVATNLVPGECPADIYTEVAQVCSKKVRAIKDDPIAQLWINYMDANGGSLPRGLAKKPVMTLPYGSTRTNCQDTLYAFIFENAGTWFSKEIRWKAVSFLTPLLWESIGEVVIKAREAMKWLQDCAAILAKSGYGLEWYTPIGFPVIQSTKKRYVEEVSTKLCGSVRITLARDTEELDVRKQCSGVSPNFVHSMDACHAQMTLHRAISRGLSAFAFIHDDFGTHAADTEVLHECIRDAFVEMYGETDPIKEFKDYNELRTGLLLPEAPAFGRLDLQNIVNSDYFFG